LSVLLPEPIEWQPILLGGIFKLTGRSSWALGDHERRAAGMAIVEARAQAYGLPAMRWPDPWPTDYLHAMRASTYAFKAGIGREFTMQAFREAFQRGVDLSILANVLHAGREVGIDAGELEAAIGAPETKQALREATDSAHTLGVIGVPTVAIGQETFWGDDRLEEAAVRLRSSP
jgi:2-hydroxychromene-2-carboxylate isomerase